MTDTFAIEQVRNGLLADIARRDTLIRDHQQSAAALEADNAVAARHAEVAQALIDQINADSLAAGWGPTTEMNAAVLVADHVALSAGAPRSGKAVARAQLLVTLHGADGLAALDSVRTAPAGGAA